VKKKYYVKQIFAVKLGGIFSTCKAWIFFNNIVNGKAP